MADTNKVKFGLKNVYYAVATDDGTGTLSYAAPVAWPGAVDLNLDVSEESDPFYADDVIYFKGSDNNGYEGTLETALIPEAFMTSVLGMTNDAKGMIVERASDERKEFALLFEFKGDKNKTRHCLYRCAAGRPGIAAHTKEGSTAPQTDTVPITAMPRIKDEVVKAKCAFNSSSSSSYATWFSEVVEPTTAS